MKIFEIYDDSIIPEERDITGPRSLSRSEMRNDTKLNELYKPKIEKEITSAATEYFPKRVGYKDYGLMADDQFEEKLEKMGWKLLETGKYSAVFENQKKDFVLKVNYRIDYGYQQYVELIKKYKNPHFPRISDIKQLSVDEDTKYHVYLIEKLYKLTDQWERRNYHIAFNAVVNRPKDSLIKIFRYQYDIPIPEILELNPKLVTALRIIGNNIGSCWNDLHAGNIMKRKDGTIVITDPYAT